MNEHEILQLGWFIIFVILITGYSLLDGFDLGVGMLHLFSKKDMERRLMLNAIGPVWDGNEVWLVTAGGALFAGFPYVYSTICSAFYTPIMVLLCGIIFRAVAIEFRSKEPMAWWRWMWDIFFSLASLIIAFGLGLVLGNFVTGIPLNAEREFAGTLLDLISPYTVFMGITAVALFSMHGCIFLLMKTEGAFHNKIREWVTPLIITFIMCYAMITVATLIYYPHMVDSVRNHKFMFVIPIINMFAIANIAREVNNGRDARAFASSCVNIICLLMLYGLGTFPNMVRAINDPEGLSLTVFNAGSSLKTLQVLFTIAGIGVPIVIAYTFTIYYIFRGKVKLDSSSY